MTEKQRQTSRLNSQHSTGPKSEAGKARSSLNALKTGIDAETTVLPGEDQEAYNQLLGEWHAHHKPTTPEARAIVDRLAANEWHTRRMLTLSTTTLARFILRNITCDKAFPIAEAYNVKQKEVDRIKTHLNSLNRNFHKDLDQLLFLEALSSEARPQESAPEETAPQPEPEPEPAPQPAESTPDNPSPASFLKPTASPSSGPAAPPAETTPKPPARAENSAETAVPTSPGKEQRIS